MPKDKEKKEITKKSDFSPRVTEKATFLGEQSVYVFNIPKGQNKTEIRKAFEKEFKIKPVKIRTAGVKNKGVIYRGRAGIKRGGKKAYVYLKKGEKIEIK
ncbi:50S ribosomal protein L23 [Candidatus Nomurabacteria bacterium RIFCSPLOWO2_01_FULL_42_20]|uniref:Large ribosomal subunit protein uL23 n=2 Tax=Parcubacteria group TaxID=1794811 RepID=A0A0H4T3T5_9BACT|nr:50S ribosomal protein L23 [uncultured Parcubacteria bacterium Rifle_16ft_4_minimus_13933]OGI70610.1 MAG: 50S ribosomal protein L23 [Candidatus Nomurabacteria bacterium RIFCSPHIGHO2_01_FULL_42_16]OGI91288.1 MAG: 50S ribosomal protein L23 [Candidatus Nomurabacteria bacterium RIFCSPLOWO2_01_FULL_42_20]